MKQLSIFDNLFAEETNATLSVPAKVSVEAQVAKAVAAVYSKPARAPYFRMSESVLDDLSGPASKVKANIAAIETAIALRKNRLTATPEQRRTMAAFTGWGGLSEVFASKSQFMDAQLRLKELLIPSEYAQAQDSVLTAYYTEPAVVQAMWEMVRSAGFQGGSVIEPSCGVGHFVGCMPDDIREKSRVTMVEIEPLTAAIAGAVYADQETVVLNCGIQDCSYKSSFDLVIGNVPFGNYRVLDSRLNHLKMPIHDYFVAKAIDMVRPGGLIALITTSGTMDKDSSNLKSLMLRKSKVLSVVRLPSGAFERLGGTNVTTDIVLLQKLAVSLDDEAAWDVAEGVIHESEVASLSAYDRKDFSPHVLPKVNSYFVRNPENVLGTFCRLSGRFGETVGVKAHADWKDRLLTLASKVPTVFKAQDSESRDGPLSAGYRNSYGGMQSMVAHGFFFSEDGRLMCVNDENKVEPQDHLPASTVMRLEGMTRIRDCVLRLMEADAGHKPEAEEIRAELNVLYGAFVKRYGFLLSPHNRRIFRVDSHAPLLWSLERWDDESEVAIRADIFHGNTVSSATLPEKAESLDDAIALSYNRAGRLDVSMVASVLNRDGLSVANELREAGRIYLDPESGDWVDALDYLSGDVRRKHAAAKAAAKSDFSLLGNADALEKVLPTWIGLSRVETRLGVPWVSAQIVSDWLQSLFRFGENGSSMLYVSCSVTYLPETGSWNATCAAEKFAVFKTQWGTTRRGFWDLLRNMLNQQTPEVFDKIELDDGKTKLVINREETLAAQEKAEAIQRSFNEWLAQSPAATEEIERDYNMRFNGRVNRAYDGSHLVVPGLNPQVQLRAAQKDSIWRGIVSGNTLYALAVGGGKTLIQICVAQEYKRLGLAKKPVLVVPNHMLEAFAGEYLRAFPRAKVLAASKDDFEGDRRKTLLMRVATGDWDCIIMTHSTFGKIGLSKETIKAHADAFKERAREAVIGVSDTNMVREAARAAKSVETKLESLTAIDRDSDILPFDKLGIDMIVVDEADLFKNLFFFTKKKRIPGISSAFSARALDLFIKSRVVFDRRNDARRGLMFSTATPISNSIGEMFVMQTYLQEERLREMNIDNFDAWSASFAREVTCVEVKPEGSGYRLHTRFARFVNVPELMMIFREVAEIRTKKMLGLPEPKLNGGAHEVIAVPPSRQQKEYVQTLVERAEAIRQGSVTPDVDNMLCVTGDGRKAALDIRCVDSRAINEPGSKINVCAQKVFDIWDATKEKKLTQLVFCDLSTPVKDGFSVYGHIKSVLMEKGVPEQEIAFAQEWSTDAEKAKLHRMVRLGQIRILIGSTELMGFGTNVQDRLVAKHDLDAPWRPRDVEQRDGRIIRQGNLNETVHIYRYVTEQTFDAYMWQTLERKAAFIAQVMENDGVARSVDDVTSQALSYAEVKALASGNPIVIEKAAVDAEVAKLEAIKYVAMQDAHRNLSKAKNAQHDADYLRESIDRLTEWLKEAQWDASSIKVFGRTYTDLKKAGEAVMSENRKIDGMVKTEKNYSICNDYRLLEAGNVCIYWQSYGSKKDLKIRIKGDDHSSFKLESMPYGAENIGSWLEKAGPIEYLKVRVPFMEDRLKNYEADAREYTLAAGCGFDQEDRLQAALNRQAEINDALEVNTDDKSAVSLIKE